MAKGGNQKVKASTAKSGFKGIDNYNIGIGGFGNASSTKVGNTISTNTQLSQPLQNINNQAQQGISANQAFINQTPEQQLASLNAGNNNYYNLQQEVNRRQAALAMADATNRYSSSGLENSTARGSFEGQLNLDQYLRDLATRQQALDYQNSTAQSNIGVNAQLMDQLYGYGSGMGQLSSANQFQGIGANDQMNMFNAQQQQQASAQNAQLAQQRAQARSAFWGNLISSAAAIAAAPMTGGTSLIGAGVSAASKAFKR